MFAAIRTVARGDAVVAPRATRRMLELLSDKLPRSDESDRRGPHPRLAELTPRELEVLQLMAEGMSNTEIAEHLVLSGTTIKTHVGNVLAKLGARDRVQAVVVAFRGTSSVRSYGAATHGFSTGNETVRLPDGALLVITSCRFADRVGQVHAGALVPDVLTDDALDVALADLARA